MAEQQKNESKQGKINQKAILKAFTLLWGLVLIVIMTLTDIGINKKFNFIDWLSNSLILIGIIVFGMLMGESMSSDRQKDNPNGLFKRAIKIYDQTYDLVKPNLDCFDQFYRYYIPKQMKDKQMEYLVSKGVQPIKAERIIDHCTIYDFQEMCEHIIERDGVKIRRLVEYEKEPVEKVLKGEIKLNPCPPSYYMSALSEPNHGYLSEQGNVIADLRKGNRKRRRITKITFTVIVSLIWGAFTFKDFLSGDDGATKAKAIANLVSRITALFTSLFSGWMSSIIDVRLQSQAIEGKTNMLLVFDESLKRKDFVVKSEKELEEEELKEYQESEKKARDSVVLPEIEIKPNLLEAKQND